MQHPFTILALAAPPLALATLTLGLAIQSPGPGTQSPGPATQSLGLAAWAAASAQDDDENQKRVEQAFAARGVHLDLTHRLVAVPAVVEVRNDLLEYLAVLPHGAAHESMFVLGADRDPDTLDAWTQSLNVALLTLGVKPGQNAEWVVKDPPPSDQELRDGATPYDVVPPRGDGFYMYAAWFEGDELFFYRVEDLVRDLDRRRTLRRHRWVYLGSRMITRRSGEECFAAALEGNLVNISFFAQGNTLLTGGLPECLQQTSWLPNAWLLPERGAQVTLLFSRERLHTLPASLLATLPHAVGGDR